MCGFIIYLSSRPVDRAQFDRARDTLNHRGPDDKGALFLSDDRIALGHRRLSIMDLSSAGHQPMHRDGAWVVFNGEIYNYPDLRQELEARGCQFSTKCDTEVLLHGYRVWGLELAQHLIGMFSFCLWDEQKRVLYCARDHAGQKPFYYHYDGQSFIAASEPKAIFALQGGRPGLRRESVKEFLIYNDIPEPYTWYKGLLSLPPANQLTLDWSKPKEAPRLHDYWQFIPPEIPLRLDSRFARDKLGELIESSVRMHQLADVEVGAFLSGGLDSSCVVALESSQRSDSVKTFSIGYDDDEGELPFAREIASKWKCSHTESRLTPSSMGAAFDRSSDVFDMPFGDTSQFPTYEVARLASKSLKVVLTGDGGDEVFGGYMNLGRYSGKPQLDTSSLFELFYGIKHRRVLTQQWQSNQNFVNAVGDNTSTNLLLGPEFKDLRDYDALWFYKKHWHAELDPFRRAQWNVFKCYLPTVLKKVDRCTMQHSLESRAPFLHPALIEFAFSLPTAIKNPRGQYKHLYKKWIASKNLVTREMLTAGKKGFDVSSKVIFRIQNDSGMSNSVKSAFELSLISREAYEATMSNSQLCWRLAIIGRALA